MSDIGLVFNLVGDPRKVFQEVNNTVANLHEPKPSMMEELGNFSGIRSEKGFWEDSAADGWRSSKDWVATHLHAVVLRNKAIESGVSLRIRFLNMRDDADGIPRFNVSCVHVEEEERFAPVEVYAYGSCMCAENLAYCLFWINMVSTKFLFPGTIIANIEDHNVDISVFGPMDRDVTGIITVLSG